MVDSRLNVNAPAAVARPGAGNGGIGPDATPTLPATPDLGAWQALVDAMMVNRAYEATALGPTIATYLAWKRLGHRADSTLETYERDLAVLALACPGSDVAAVTVADLAHALAAVPHGSHGRARKSWSAFFAWAAKAGQRSGNPVEELPRLKKTPPGAFAEHLWRQDELDLLVAGARMRPEPLIERLRVQTMVESGARASELCGLQLFHFDLGRKTIVVTGKGSKKRLVPISGELVGIVDEYLLTPYPIFGRDPVGSDFVWFPIWRGPRNVALRLDPTRPMDYRSFNYWWHRMCETAGVRYRKPHMMRHTFATDVLDATNGDLYAVKELLGHSSTLVTEVYLHSSRTRTEGAVRALGEYRKGQRTQGVEV